MEILDSSKLKPIKRISEKYIKKKQINGNFELF